jgi:hypothetical protein
MRPPALRVFVVAIVAGLSVSCAYARGIPIGTPQPPRPPDCRLAYTHLDPADAQARWRQVGDVCVSDMDATVNEMYEPGSGHDALTERACELGGQMVTPVGLCANGKASAIEFGVYVPR